MYMYKSRSESWMYECFVHMQNIVNYTFYKCKSWKNVLMNDKNQNRLEKLFRSWSTGLFAKTFWGEWLTEIMWVLNALALMEMHLYDLVLH